MGRTHLDAQAVVIDSIRAAGTTSRSELVAATGLTGATISTVVRRLIDDGLVLETGRAESTGGKPRVLLELNHDARFAVGVHLDDAGIVYVLTTLDGAVVGRMSRAGANLEDPPVVVGRVAREVAALVDGAGVDHARVLGLGLVAPGPLTGSSGMPIHPPSIRHWADFPLGDALERACGVPVLLDNDANAAALGEHWTARGSTAGTVAALYLGAGVGAGIVVDGAAHRGASGNAGEIGHLSLDPAGPRCWCGDRGCVEVLAAPVAVVDAARQDRDLARDAGLEPVGRRATVLADFAAVSRLALRGDARAVTLLEDSARWLARAARAVSTVLDIDLVVLTGPGAAAAGSFYQPVLQAALDRSYLTRTTHPVTVRVSVAARTAAAVGAAAMVLQDSLVPTRRSLRLPERFTDAGLPPGA